MDAMEYFGQKNLPTSFQKALSACMENLVLKYSYCISSKKNVKLFRYIILDYWQGANSDKQRSSDMYHLQKFMIRK